VPGCFPGLAGRSGPPAKRPRSRGLLGAGPVGARRIGLVGFQQAPLRVPGATPRRWHRFDSHRSLDHRVSRRIFGGPKAIRKMATSHASEER
jgi:hypothetical protein